MAAEELTPELKLVYDYMIKHACEWLSVRDVRLSLGLTNGATRYRLHRLAQLEYVNTYLAWVTEPRIRRRWFHYKKNKLVALHKRWFYKSPRGKGHDISIEAVASIIVSGTEKKEDYEEILRSALEEELGTAGFERVSTELSQELLGFEEKITDEPVTDVRVETLEWWHKIFEVKQLEITEFLR